MSKRHRGRGLGRQLVNACLAKLRRAGIAKCNIFIFANNAEGMKFWTHTGWNLRTELRLMQIRLECRVVLAETAHAERFSNRAKPGNPAKIVDGGVTNG